MDSPAQIKLDHILSKRLALYSGADRRRRRLASMYVTDAYGNHHFDCLWSRRQPQREQQWAKLLLPHLLSTVAESICPRIRTEIGSIKPLTTRTCRRRFQVPRRVCGRLRSARRSFSTTTETQPDAMFVVTVNLGDFELLQSKQGNNQVAVLVEARPGPTQGTILQHPLMEGRRTAGVNMEGEKYQITPDLMERLLAGSDVDYLDPLAAVGWRRSVCRSLDRRDAAGLLADGGSPPEEPSADGESTPIESDPTDLLVLVQYRLEKVIAPVAGMRSALLWEGASSVGIDPAGDARAVAGRETSHQQSELRSKR